MIGKKWQVTNEFWNSENGVFLLYCLEWRVWGFYWAGKKKQPAPTDARINGTVTGHNGPCSAGLFVTTTWRVLG